MTWTKLSDDFPDDCWGLTDAAFRLHVEGLVWSNRKLLDCRIPADDVRRFAKSTDALPELLDTGWWTEDAGTYVINHHASYQRRRDAVLNQQAANQRNGRRGGRPRTRGTGATRERWGETESETQSVTKTESERAGTGLDGPGTTAATTRHLEHEQPTPTSQLPPTGRVVDEPDEEWP